MRNLAPFDWPFFAELHRHFASDLVRWIDRKSIARSIATSTGRACGKGHDHD